MKRKSFSSSSLCSSYIIELVDSICKDSADTQYTLKNGKFVSHLHLHMTHAHSLCTGARLIVLTFFTPVIPMKFVVMYLGCYGNLMQTSCVLDVIIPITLFWIPIIIRIILYHSATLSFMRTNCMEACTIPISPGTHYAGLPV